MVEIPLIQAPNQELLVILGEQNCTLAIYQRNAGVFLDLSMLGGVVCRGAVCTPGQDILQVAQTVFSGALYIVDLQNQSKEQAAPHWSGLGSRWRLYYLTATEKAELADKELTAALALGFSSAWEYAEASSGARLQQEITRALERG